MENKQGILYLRQLSFNKRKFQMICFQTQESLLHKNNLARLPNHYHKTQLCTKIAEDFRRPSFFYGGSHKVSVFQNGPLTYRYYRCISRVATTKLLGTIIGL